MTPQERAEIVRAMRAGLFDDVVMARAEALVTPNGYELVAIERRFRAVAPNVQLIERVLAEEDAVEA